MSIPVNYMYCQDVLKIEVKNKCTKETEYWSIVIV